MHGSDTLISGAITDHQRLYCLNVRELAISTAALERTQMLSQNRAKPGFDDFLSSCSLHPFLSPTDHSLQKNNDYECDMLHGGRNTQYRCILQLSVPPNLLWCGLGLPNKWTLSPARYHIIFARNMYRPDLSEMPFILRFEYAPPSPLDCTKSGVLVLTSVVSAIQWPH